MADSHVDLADAQSPSEVWEQLNALMCKLRAEQPALYRWVQAQSDPFAELRMLVSGGSAVRAACEALS